MIAANNNSRFQLSNDIDDLIWICSVANKVAQEREYDRTFFFLRWPALQKVLPDSNGCRLGSNISYHLNLGLRGEGHYTKTHSHNQTRLTQSIKTQGNTEARSQLNCV